MRMLSKYKIKSMCFVRLIDNKKKMRLVCFFFVITTNAKLTKITNNIALQIF